jgi:hypothetical protein
MYYGHLVFLPFGILYGHLVYFVVIWHILLRFGKNYQEKSGNLGPQKRSRKNGQKLTLETRVFVRHFLYC